MRSRELVASWKAYPLSQRITVVVFALILAGLGSCGLAGWKLWRDARDKARYDAHSLSVLLTEQTARTLQGAGSVLREIQADLAEAQVDTDEAFRAQVSSRAFFDAINNRLKDLPQIAALSMIDADGKLMNSSRRWPSPPISLFDRDYFAFCSKTPGGFFIGSTVHGRSVNAPVFFMAQCIPSSQGKLLGVLTAVMSVDYFMGFYSTIGLLSGADVAVLRLDGTVLVRYPRDQSALAVPPIVPGATEQTVLVPGDGVRGARYVSTNQLTSYPIAVSVGISERYALARWRQQVQWITVGCLCAAACLLVLLRRLLVVVQRSERSQMELAERHAALLTTQAALQAQAADLVAAADALRLSEAKLADQTNVLETTLEHMDQGLMMITAARRVAVCNRKAIEMLDLPRALMESQPAFSEVLAHQWQSEEFSYTSADIKEFVRAGGVLDRFHTYERQRPNGKVIEVCSVPLEDGGMVRTYTEITERKRAEQRLVFLAYHDALTGLANRHVLGTRLQAAVGGGGAVGGDPGVAVCYLDLDRFKLVNDTRGHAAGDDLLVQVARRMQGCLRDVDLVARMGGDEFAVVLSVGADRDAALRFAERLKTVVSEPYELGGQVARIGVSIGIAVHPADGTTAEALLRSADSALYRAKASGRNAICWYESQAEQEDRGRFILEQDLRLALAGEQFELAYQPVFDVVTGLPVAVEALLRWRHPTRGMLSPDHFISIAEDTGIINALGRWVIETACTEAATWAMPVRLAVNVSSVQFENPGLEEQVVAALRSSGLAVDRLCLEVTERLLVSDSELVANTMLALHGRGVRLVMDDFGVGHSSLKTLRRFPFQQVKIDRTFVTSIGDEAGSGAIVRAMLALAESMKLDIVAEGVETPEQLAKLRELGCRYVQGFLLQGPQTPEWIRNCLWNSTTARSEYLRGSKVSASSQ